jgi:cyanophycinase-like exopeptidase
MTVEAAHDATIAALAGQFAQWECDKLDDIITPDRVSARQEEYSHLVEQATGIVLVGDDPLQWAAILGGTPLAQMIRRANARSKLVAGVGAVGAFLCQHIISAGAQPATLRGAVSFGPGLGLVNRIVVDVSSTSAAHSDACWLRLLPTPF